MIRIFPLDFLAGPGAMFTPSDPKLHDQAVEFCRKELTREVNLTELAKVWVAKDSETVVGIFGYVLKPDVPLMRATSVEALRMMANRYNDYLADMGARGKETFIYVSRKEKPECKCPGWAEVLKEWDAELADRVTVKVR
jgi:hypothetical protein